MWSVSFGLFRSRPHRHHSTHQAPPTRYTLQVTLASRKASASAALFSCKLQFIISFQFFPTQKLQQQARNCH
ncbi:hypothetical protein COLO4_19500 [Corchorus olitorius]|uniref:Uncharacterized protein n=1 Tax=Corchorus olitorius TaxID=93759 RepID=A0A1R3J553_9ROSI|nr:hypothetical protein COLO4_19500 [Corchorus olitorius]